MARSLPPEDRWWEAHARALRRKGLLRRIHASWYGEIAAWIPGGPGAVVELGSGGGFFADSVPGAFATDCPARPGIRVGADAAALPFRTSSLRALVLVNVFHHLPRPRAFLSDAVRALRPGGRILLVEPWVTPWSRLVYSRVHHEPCDPGAPSWDREVLSPLEGANEALPWIVFARDRRLFESSFAALSVLSLRPGLPVMYLLSGGLSFRALAPGAAWPLLRFVERPFEHRMAMFATIVLEKRPAP